jgi:hypothetical protein
MAKSNSKRSKAKAPKKAATSGMVTKSSGGGAHAKGSSFMVNKNISSAKKGNSVSAPRKAGGS